MATPRLNLESRSVFGPWFIRDMVKGLNIRGPIFDHAYALQAFKEMHCSCGSALYGDYSCPVCDY
jgi:hypothetical protein